MSEDGKLIILSDLHLWGPEDPLYRALLKFIDEKISQNDRFFIVGDLFDLYIGNKSVFSERYNELLTKMQSLQSKNVEIYYIEGNHDFQLEGVFENSPHIKLFSSHIHFEWDNRLFYFCHGDRINWKDFGYQAFRMLTHNLITQCLIQVAPGGLVDKVGSTMSKASRGQHPEADEETVKMFRNYACEQISEGYDFVIMGHSHYLDDMKFKIDQHEGQYINCGYPRKHRKFYLLEKGQKFFSQECWEELVLPTKPKFKVIGT